MKKLFVLFLCLMAVAGFVSAGTVHPPGTPALALSEYGVGYEAVTPDTVLAVAAHELPGRRLAVSNMESRGLPEIWWFPNLNVPIIPVYIG
jgi:hypothetical protein